MIISKRSLKKIQSSTTEYNQPSTHNNDEEPNIQIDDEEINPATAAVSLENETAQDDTNTSINSSTIESLDEQEMNSRLIKRRRLSNTTLIDIINELNIEQEWRRKSSELTCYGTLRRHADWALAYLIQICGFKDITSIAYNKKRWLRFFYCSMKSKPEQLHHFD